MVVIDPDLRVAMRQAPKEPVNLIVRVSGDVEQRAILLSEHGVRIRRKLRLTNALSIRCAGEVALQIVKFSWVERVELDRPVRALGR